MLIVLVLVSSRKKYTSLRNLLDTPSATGCGSASLETFDHYVMEFKKQSRPVLDKRFQLCVPFPQRVHRMLFFFAARLFERHEAKAVDASAFSVTETCEIRKQRTSDVPMGALSVPLFASP